MANIWRGDAQSVAQVNTITVGGTAAATQVYSVTINLKTISYTAIGGDTNSTIAAALRALLAASTIPEFAEVTWTVLTTVITAASKTVGVPFTNTSSATGTGTLVTATTTANTGKYNWDDPDNWSEGRIPAGACATPVQNAPSLVAGGGLGSGTTYYYVLTAVNGNGETVKSNEQNATPSGGNLSVNLTWTAVSGADSIKIFRSTSAGVYTDTLIATIDGALATYTDTGDTPGAGTPPGVSTAVGDDIILDQNATPIYYGTDQDYIVPASFTQNSTYSGKIGLPAWNPLGYYEYRNRYLKISPAVVQLHYGIGGNGSSQIFLDTGSKACTILIYGAGTAPAAGVPAVQLLCNHASTTVTVMKGSVGIANDPGSVSMLDSVRTGYQTTPSSDVTLYLGSGCDLTSATVNVSGGLVYLRSTVSILTVNVGTVIATGPGIDIDTLNALGGQLTYNSDGTIGAYTISNFTIDFSQENKARTMTSGTISGKSVFRDPSKTVTMTSPIVVTGKDVVFDWGASYSLQRT